MKIVKTIITVILCTLMGLSAIGGPVLFGLNRALVPEEICENILSEDDGRYYATVISSVRSSIEKRMALVVITPEDISEYLTDDVLSYEAERALSCTVSGLLGYNTKEPVYRDEALLTHIDTLLNEYAAENDVEYEEGSAEKVYEMITDTVNTELRAIPESYVTKVAPLIEKVIPLTELWFICPDIWCVCAAILLILYRKEIGDILFTMSLSSYIGSLAVLAVTCIVCDRDYLSGTVLGDGAFMLTIRGVWNTAVSSVRDAAIIFVGIFTVLFAVSVVLRAIKRVRSDETHEVEDET